MHLKNNTRIAEEWDHGKGLGSKNEDSNLIYEFLRLDLETKSFSKYKIYVFFLSALNIRNLHRTSINPSRVRKTHLREQNYSDAYFCYTQGLNSVHCLRESSFLQLGPTNIDTRYLVFNL